MVHEAERRLLPRIQRKGFHERFEVRVLGNLYRDVANGRIGIDQLI